MAVRNSVALTDHSGRPVSPGNIVVAQVNFNFPTFNVNEEGNWDGTVTRVITYQLRIYDSLQIFQESKGKSVISSGVTAFPMGWARTISEEEFTALMNNGALAEVWLKDWIQGIIGGTSEVINPYTQE